MTTSLQVNHHQARLISQMTISIRQSSVPKCWMRHGAFLGAFCCGAGLWALDPKFIERCLCRYLALVHIYVVSGSNGLQPAELETLVATPVFFL
jgi:hypothetical protein